MSDIVGLVKDLAAHDAGAGLQVLGSERRESEASRKGGGVRDVRNSSSGICVP